VDNYLEHYHRTEGNFHFYLLIIDILKDLTKDVPNLRVLDYGAGAIPYTITPISVLQKDQHTVAYDPQLAEDIFKALPGINSIQWVKEPPLGQAFDLAVCHFSLHHMTKPPMEALGELKDYHLSLVTIADYDFTDSTFEEFRKVFIADQELKELRTVFGGDWEACFAYHSRFGLNAYQQALETNGFNLIRIERGKGIAKNKILLIGKVPFQDRSNP